MSEKTRTGRLADTPAQVGLPEGVRDPIRPAWFAGKREARLGGQVGVSQFGVNHVTLPPGGVSALRHWHEQEDEFVYVLAGDLVLIDETGEHPLRAGDYAGFPAGAANAHHLANRSEAPAEFLAIGTRHRGVERIHYSDDPELGVTSVTRDANGVRA